MVMICALSAYVIESYPNDTFRNNIMYNRLKARFTQSKMIPTEKELFLMLFRNSFNSLIVNLAIITKQRIASIMFAPLNVYLSPPSRANRSFYQIFSSPSTSSVLAALVSSTPIAGSISTDSASSTIVT